MNKLLLIIPALALVTLGVILVANHKSHNLQHEENTTTFTQWKTCISNLKQQTCDDIQNDETEKSNCYAASYGISRKTFIDGDLLTSSCKSFLEYQAKSQASDLLNGNDYYKYCYASNEVALESYKSKFYQQNIYYPIYLKCAGFQ